MTDTDTSKDFDVWTQACMRIASLSSHWSLARISKSGINVSLNRTKSY